MGQGPTLRDALLHAMCAGAYRRDHSEMHPAIWYAPKVKFIMADAIAMILTEAGTWCTTTPTT